MWAEWTCLEAKCNGYLLFRTRTARGWQSLYRTCVNNGCGVVHSFCMPAYHALKSHTYLGFKESSSNIHHTDDHTSFEGKYILLYCYTQNIKGHNKGMAALWHVGFNYDLQQLHIMDNCTAYTPSAKELIAWFFFFSHEFSIIADYSTSFWKTFQNRILVYHVIPLTMACSNRVSPLREILRDKIWFWWTSFLSRFVHWPYLLLCS